MNRSFLVKLIGFPATLIHGDPSTLARWLWVKKHLPRTSNHEKLIDVGCGTGAYTIGAAKRGYEALGLSWDEKNKKEADQRAAICNTKAQFGIQDVRRLDERKDLHGQFDVAICCEVIEHILDDRKVMEDIHRCLKPGGYLIFTTPYYHYRAITPGDNGPFLKSETGWHVRRGYTQAMLSELCEQSGFKLEEISYCSGFFSQKVSWLTRSLQDFNHVLGWVISLPLRILPILFDSVIHRLTGWPYYSIGMIAYKPRFNK